MPAMPKADAAEALAALCAGLPVEGARRLLAGALRAAGVETPELDARLLAQEVTGLSHAALIAERERPLTVEQAARLRAFARRRLAGEPVSRILGRRAFFGRTFTITPDVLDPRPETELLVEAALRLRPGVEQLHEGPPVACDLGAGSGAIIVSLLAEWPALRGLAVDISAPALAVARRNAATHGVARRLLCVHGNWLDPVRGPVDVLLANPPYIPQADIAALQREVREHDPHLALSGGADGLSAYRAIARRARAVLNPGGWLLMEVGAGQAKAVRDLFLRTGLVVDEAILPSILPDLAGIGRAIAMKRNN